MSSIMHPLASVDGATVEACCSMRVSMVCDVSSPPRRTWWVAVFTGDRDEPSFSSCHQWRFALLDHDKFCADPDGFDRLHVHHEDGAICSGLQLGEEPSRVLPSVVALLQNVRCRNWFVLRLDCGSVIGAPSEQQADWYFMASKDAA